MSQSPATATVSCYAARTGEGYWTCDVPGGCKDCRSLAAGLGDRETFAPQVCADCGGPTRQAFPTTTAYRSCRRCGHVHPTTHNQEEGQS